MQKHPVIVSDCFRGPLKTFLLLFHKLASFSVPLLLSYLFQAIGFSCSFRTECLVDGIFIELLTSLQWWHLKQWAIKYTNLKCNHWEGGGEQYRVLWPKLNFPAKCWAEIFPPRCLISCKTLTWPLKLVYTYTQNRHVQCTLYSVHLTQRTLNAGIYTQPNGTNGLGRFSVFTISVPGFILHADNVMTMCLHEDKVHLFNSHRTPNKCSQNSH